MFSGRKAAVQVPQPGTPPAQVIEELTAAIADLKDELATAKEAKRYAQENLKVQMAANEALESDMAKTRSELIEMLAKQQAEMPVMTAPSPTGGTTKIRIDDDHYVTLIEGESVIRSLSDRVKVLEKEAVVANDLFGKQRAEADSLREINSKNMLKMKELLNRFDQEEETKLLKEQIAALEAQLSISKEISAQVEAIATEIEARDARIQALEQQVEEKVAEVKRLQQEVTQRHTESREIERLQSEIDRERRKSASMEQELETERKENDQIVDKLKRQVEEHSVLVATLQANLAAVPDIAQLRQSVEENENQIIQLVDQVSALRADLKARELELETARNQSDTDAKKISLISEKVSESADALSAALHSAQQWKAKYLTDIRSVTSRLSSLKQSGTVLPPPTLGLL